VKINQDLRIGMDKTSVEQKTSMTNSSNFGSIVQKSGEKLHVDELNKLLSQIEDAGNRLERSRTFKDLAKYKTLVKQFVQQAVSYSMKMKQSQTWNQYGENRKLNLVETIDKKLADMTEEYIQKEQPSIDILGKIGEIKGLLINLYT